MRSCSEESATETRFAAPAGPGAALAGRPWPPIEIGDHHVRLRCRWQERGRLYDIPDRAGRRRPVTPREIDARPSDDGAVQRFRTSAKGIAMDGKEIIERTADAWNRKDRAGFLACYSADCEFVTPPDVGKGHDAIIKFWDDNVGIWPDNRVRVTLLVGEGDVIAEEGIAEGTNTGPIPLPDGTEAPASGNAVSFPYAAVHTLRGDKIVSTRFYWDNASIYQQLGLA